MNVNEIMTSSVQSCNVDTDLAAVAKMMWDCDCGAVPVVDSNSRVVGMVTDRDICIAAATRSEVPSNLRAHEVMSIDVHSCRARDEVRTALRTMKRYRVRRLPVLDDQERLVGIVSLNDLVMPASCRQGADVPGEEFLETMRSVCAHTAAPVAV